MPSIEIKPVERADVMPLISIELPPEQDNFVAPNAVSLAQVHYEGGGYPFCIWLGDQRAGLVQVIDLAECHQLEEGEDPNSIYLWRLLIDPQFQRRGVGLAVLAWLDAWAKKREKTDIYVTCSPKNFGAMTFYEASGYARTGRVVDREVEFRKAL